ncbi:MAG: energy transducer TonB [Bacteroidales bacterium]|nr:energy transducer TonB [Bacteroidales bacterium]MBN2758237.1 energy transducer TonB [Bacteroidales bacterium]
MELKKNSKADLEKWKSIFFQAGLVISLGAILVAFNVTAHKGNVDDLGQRDNVQFEEEDIPVTRQEEPPPTTPPPPQQVVEVLNIVDDKTIVEEEFEMDDTDVDENTQIEFVEIKEEEEEEEAQIFFIVEKMPEFPGGELGLRKYISTHVNYPNIARENGIEGRIYVRFCVTSTGNVEKVSIARGVDPILDKEALRVVKELPKWKAGEQRGKKVNVWYTVPINFQLQ